MDSTASGVASATRTAQSGIRSAADAASEQAENATDRAKDGARTAAEAITKASQQMKDKAANLADQVGGAAENLKQTVGEIGDVVTDHSSSIGGQITQTAAGSRDQAARIGRQITDMASSLVNQQPLLCAAIGVAFGAAIAAALPSTKTEDQLMGGASDAVKKAASDRASDQYDTTKSAAARVAHEAKSAVGREILTPPSGAGAVREVGDRIERVLSGTTEAVREEIGNFAEGDTKGR
jgi:hypothetical protein